METTKPQTKARPSNSEVFLFSQRVIFVEKRESCLHDFVRDHQTVNDEQSKIRVYCKKCGEIQDGSTL